MRVVVGLDRRHDLDSWPPRRRGGTSRHAGPRDSAVQPLARERGRHARRHPRREPRLGRLRARHIRLGCAQVKLRGGISCGGGFRPLSRPSQLLPQFPQSLHGRCGAPRLHICIHSCRREPRRCLRPRGRRGRCGGPAEEAPDLLRRRHGRRGRSSARISRGCAPKCEPAEQLGG